MAIYSYSIEGLNLQIDLEEKTGIDNGLDKRMLPYLIKDIRDKSGMPITVFCKWLGIPLRTMEQWERGDRAMPEYVLRLIAYKVAMEKKLGNI